MNNDTATAFTHAPIAMSGITKSERKNSTASKKAASQTGFEIEHNIPIPPLALKNSFPFSEMAHADSFFVPLEGKTEAKVRNRIQGAFRRWKQVNNQPANIKQTTRTTSKDGIPGIRFWLLKE